MKVFSLTLWSGQIPAEFRVLDSTWDTTQERLLLFAYGAITLFGRLFQIVLLNRSFFTLRQVCIPVQMVPQRPGDNTCRLSRHRNLGFSRFARRY